MLLSEIKTIIEYKLSGAKKLPNDTSLSILFNEAMSYVANKCVPQELLRVAELSEDEVLRNIEDGAFIAIPETPDFTSTEAHLQIDEDLTYAVINYVAFLVTSKPDNKIMADEIINEHIANEGREYYVDISTTE